MLHLTAKPEVRFLWIKKRGRTGDPKTFEEFLEQENRDRQKFNLKKTISMADYTIENDSSVDELHNKLDALISKFLK